MQAGGNAPRSWDGLLYTSDPEARALNQAYCDGYEALVGAGVIFDGLSMPLFNAIVYACAWWLKTGWLGFRNREMTWVLKGLRDSLRLIASDSGSPAALKFCSCLTV